MYFLGFWGRSACHHALLSFGRPSVLGCFEMFWVSGMLPCHPLVHQTLYWAFFDINQSLFGYHILEYVWTIPISSHITVFLKLGHPDKNPFQGIFSYNFHWLPDGTPLFDTSDAQGAGGSRVSGVQMYRAPGDQTSGRPVWNRLSGRKLTSTIYILICEWKNWNRTPPKFQNAPQWMFFSRRSYGFKFSRSPCWEVVFSCHKLGYVSDGL